MSQSRQSTHIVLFFLLLSALVVVLLALTVAPSRAAIGDLTFTVEGPGVQASQVSSTNNFVDDAVMMCSDILR
jgi:hypothetical protein